MLKTFTIDGKNYTIKKELKFGEYRKFNKISSKLAQLAKVTNENLTEEQQKEFLNTNTEQMNFIVDFLESHLGLSQQEIEELSFADANNVFQEAFKQSTTVDTELKKTSDLQ